MTNIECSNCGKSNADIRSYCVECRFELQPDPLSDL